MSGEPRSAENKGVRAQQTWELSGTQIWDHLNELELSILTHQSIC